MATIRLPYVQEYVDRHGKVRRYLRRTGCRRVALKGLPGSPEFMASYQSGIASKPAPKPARDAPGSLHALIVDYFRSAAFANLKASTQKTYRIALEPVLEEHGHRPAAGLDSHRAQRIIEDIGATKPGLANLTRAVLHRICKLAVKRGVLASNPFAGSDSYIGGTHHTWTDDELAAYEAKWALGTRERLAYALLLYTDQRGCDVVKMRRSDITKAGTIRLEQQKARKGTVKAMELPLHPALTRAIKACEAKGLHLIGDAAGRPISRNSLTNLIKRAAKDAGLPPRCKAHGLRKATLRRLAERGATSKELQAVGGHATLKEVERYTEAADQVRLARTAMERLEDE